MAGPGGLLDATMIGAAFVIGLLMGAFAMACFYALRHNIQ
jgi:hypothetical protein